MPHVGSASGDDLASSDEIKVFKDEGEDEKRASENLTDLKSSLITEGEQDKSSQVSGQSFSSNKTNNHHNQRPESNTPSFGKPSSFDAISHSHFGYALSHSPYHHHHHHANGNLGTVPMANKVPMVGGPHPSSPLSFMMPNIDAFPQPPPAHMGIHIDPKTGIPRPSMYPLTGHGQYSHPVFPDFAQQLQWHTPAMYPITSSAFRGTYPSLSSVTSPSFSAFPRPLIPPHPSLPGHPGLTHQAFLAASAGQKHQEFAAAVAAASAAGINNHISDANNITQNSSRQLPPYSSHSSLGHIDQKPSLSRITNGSSTGTNSGQVLSPPHNNNNNNNTNNSANHSIQSPGTPDSFNGKISKHQKDNKGMHVKKPLNAFMLYMKEMRAKVVAECTLKESAAINQILGRRWHSLTREEQAKYYDMARKERQIHMQLYPGWTARDNYAANAKKKKKKRDKNSDGEGGTLKKCRARFGLDQQNNWCKPCRRKKKCIRYLDNGDTAGESEDNIGSVGSIEAPTPDSKSANESDHDNLNLSSAELSLSSPPVPSSDYIIPHHNHHMIHHIHNEITPRVQLSTSSSSLAPACHPPRNSPFSIEQLARPHCPTARSSTLIPSLTVNNNNNSVSVNNSINTNNNNNNNNNNNSLNNNNNNNNNNNREKTVSSKTPTSSSSNSFESIAMPQLPTPPSSSESTTSTASPMLPVA